MKVLIFGGTAFTGPHIVNELSGLGHEVYVYHRGQHLLEPRPVGVKKINATMSSLKIYQAALRQMKFDVVLHMLAMHRLDAQQAIDALAGHVGRIVVASSQDVYAPFGALHGKEEHTPLPHPLDEAGPLRTSRQLYGNNYEKIYMEQAFLENQSRLPVTIIRMPATYGPHDPRNRFFEYLKRMDDKRPAILLEPAMANFRWTHGYVENVAHALALAVTTPHPDGITSRIYNVSELPPNRDAGITNGAPTVAERLHWLARAAGYRGRIVVVPRDRCPPHLIAPMKFEHDVITNDAKIRAELGYKELVDMEEGLKRTVAWQRAHMPEKFDPKLFDYAAEDVVIKEFGIA